VQELQAGLWHWEASHPEWKPGEEWDEQVSSYAIDDGRRLLLFDPLALPSELEALAAERDTAVVLTCPWHARDARAVVETLGAELHAPPPDQGDPSPLEARVFRAGEHLPIGIEAFPGFEPNDLVLWVPSSGALIAGDTLIDRGHGLELPLDWLREGVTREEIVEGLRPVLSLPVEHVLLTHGGPSDRAALEQALA
jgi:glyoxylase-like metal-dependent hydrolase (beta-lactamase superfamily II)